MCNKKGDIRCKNQNDVGSSRYLKERYNEKKNSCALFINFNENIKFIGMWLRIQIKEICIRIANEMCEVVEMDFI